MDIPEERNKKIFIIKHMRTSERENLNFLQKNSISAEEIDGSSVVTEAPVTTLKFREK